LLEGDVFTREVFEARIRWKEENERNPSRLRPPPFELMQNFDT
jgi:hypothetical protein